MFCCRYYYELPYMLRRLHISNFALINEMDVCFPGKLTVITGETGAGKSIFLEGLSLALGQRADVSTLQDRNRKCIIEAEFDTGQCDLEEFFEREGIDPAAELILRREINPEGRSRSFLNDTPVSLSALKTLSEKLIDVHSQHQNLLLNQSDFQLEVLDAFAGTSSSFREYSGNWNALQRLRHRLSALKEEETVARKEQDYLLFLSNEFGEVELWEGLLRKLEEDSILLENAVTIKAGLLQAAEAINGGEKNFLQEIARLRQLLSNITKLSQKYLPLQERVNAVMIEMKDIANELEQEGEALGHDPEKLEITNTTLDKLNRLLKKHHVKDEAELMKAKEEIENKLKQFSSLETEILKLERLVVSEEEKCMAAAKKISKARLQAIPSMEKEIGTILGGLSMPNAIFKISHSLKNEPGQGGIDSIRFLFSANKGGVPSELQKVASGGELSRLMLSLKSLLASKKGLPAIIFDEIDSGVSGDVADKIGNILSKMGKSMQVICITHLPQIASKGSHHLFVYKKDDEKRTTSHIRELSGEDRIAEIAKMLSTGKPTPSALKNAKELLNMN